MAWPTSPTARKSVTRGEPGGAVDADLGELHRVSARVAGRRGACSARRRPRPAASWRPWTTAPYGQALGGPTTASTRPSWAPSSCAGRCMTMAAASTRRAFSSAAVAARRGAAHVGHPAAETAEVVGRRLAVGFGDRDQVGAHLELFGDDQLPSPCALPQPTSCRLALKATLPSSFIFSAIVLKSGKLGRQDAVLVGAAGHAHADAVPLVAARGAQALAPAEGLGAALEALAHPRVAQRHPGQGVDVVGSHQVLQAQVDGIDAELAGDLVEGDLHRRSRSRARRSRGRRRRPASSCTPPGRGDGSAACGRAG